MRHNRRFVILLAGIFFAVDFTYLTARHALTSTRPAGDIAHIFLLAAGLFCVGFAAWEYFRRHERNPVQLLGTAVMAATILLVALGLIRLGDLAAFRIEGGMPAPDGIMTVIVSALLAYLGGTLSLILLAIFTQLIFIKRRRYTKRNFTAFLSIEAFYIMLFTLQPAAAEEGHWTILLTSLLLVSAMLVNGFRFSWILVLTRREKIANLVLSFFGVVFFTMLTIDGAVFTFSPSVGAMYKAALGLIHPALDALFSTVCLFASIYMGIGFSSTLLHLPTAREFDRKKAEISSFRNMSKLVTEVFDMDDLLSTAAHLATEISEGDGAWIELQPSAIPSRNTGLRRAVEEQAQRLAQRKMTPEQHKSLALADGRPISSLVLETGKAVTVQDLQRDRRFMQQPLTGSLAVLPLRVQSGIAGFLGVHKKNPYDIDKDLVTVLSAFSDLVSIALENSRLISESIIRERFSQELDVARTMQHSLLPALLPTRGSYDIYARSLPAWEVGGDYYDVTHPDSGRMGIIIGDVSGKGVSAALYMAQVKGIFQSITADMSSPRGLLDRMNATLCRTLDKKSFISLLYALLDLQSGKLAFARAGHCPLLYINGDGFRYFRPDGMGLGLDASERFQESIKEEAIQMTPGDIVIMYTDGVTEARDASGEEFGASRLAESALSHRDESAKQILDAIFENVAEHTGRGDSEDDMTLLVLRWNGGIEDSQQIDQKDTMDTNPIHGQEAERE